jgi:hypothetical protein
MGANGFRPGMADLLARCPGVILDQLVPPGSLVCSGSPRSSASLAWVGPLK